MINETSNPEPTTSYTSFGARLKAGREQLRLSEKDIALRLHLPPLVIIQLENDATDTALPKVFLKGYLRSYARFLHINEEEIHSALQLIENLEPNPTSHKTPLLPPPSRLSSPSMMRWVTYAIILVLIGLVGTWRYNRNHNTERTIAAPAPITITTALPTPTAISTTVAVNPAPTDVPTITAPPSPPVATTETTPPHANEPAKAKAAHTDGKDDTAANEEATPDTDNDSQ